MPEKKPVQKPVTANVPATVTKKVQMPFKGYIRCDIQRSEKDEYLQWRDGFGDEELCGFLDSVVDDNYRFGVSFKDEQCIASMTDCDPERVMYGYVLTAFANTAVGALCALAYKHLVKLDKDWGTGANDDDWTVR